ncbi:cytochrome P460 family protein [Chryseolinea sp. T2]|uniref:cytochrome P460 family protein n=1 Tax=Chryseolinea sp. T2 TaxID=3129255 RepID=UPI0030772A9A
MKSFPLSTKVSLVSFVVLMYISISSFTSGIFTAQSEFDDVQDVTVAYPEGYRHWTHVKTYIVKPKSPSFPTIGGFNHVYANDKAMIGYKTGNFPNGSIIVSDVIVALDDSLNTREGTRSNLSVMIKDTINIQDPGGWRFETFEKDSKTTRMLTPTTRLKCNNCHKRNQDMVFSDYRQ